MRVRNIRIVNHAAPSAVQASVTPRTVGACTSSPGHGRVCGTLNIINWKGVSMYALALTHLRGPSGRARAPHRCPLLQHAAARHKTKNHLPGDYLGSPYRRRQRQIPRQMRRPRPRPHALAATLLREIITFSYRNFLPSLRPIVMIVIISCSSGRSSTSGVSKCAIYNEKHTCSCRDIHVWRGHGDVAVRAIYNYLLLIFMMVIIVNTSN
jgi:hypothetical protein